MAETTQRNFRIRSEVLEVLDQLEARMGINQTAIVHLAILEYAERLLTPSRPARKSRKNPAETT